MLAGERFSDRPASVCPMVGALLRAYNDSLDDARRQDLYRFAAEAVGTRGDFGLQRARAELALTAAGETRADRPKKRRDPVEPDPDAGPEEIAEYVVDSMARRAYSRYRSRRWDDCSHERMIALLERMIATGASAGVAALLGELVEQPSEPVEHGGGDDQLLIGELGNCGAEAGLVPSAPLFDERAPVFGERGEDDAPVSHGAQALDEAAFGEPLEHLGDAGRAELGGVGELAGGQLVAVAQAEEERVLGVAECPVVARFAPAHPPHRSHRTLERSAELLGGIALVALAVHARRRGR